MNVVDSTYYRPVLRKLIRAVNEKWEAERFQQLFTQAVADWDAIPGEPPGLMFICYAAAGLELTARIRESGEFSYVPGSIPDDGILIMDDFDASMTLNRQASSKDWDGLGKSLSAISSYLFSAAQALPGLKLSIVDSVPQPAEMRIVGLPERTTTTSIERDTTNKITTTTQVERDGVAT